MEMSPEHFPFRLILPMSLPGLTGQSSIHGWCLLDRPVKPGDDTDQPKQEMFSNSISECHAPRKGGRKMSKFCARIGHG
jgi:hypothetical protein